MNFHFLDFLGPIVCLISLVVAWKDINARYMLFCCLLGSAVSLLTLEWAMTKPILFYAWSMSMSAIFLILLFGRRYWAYKFDRLQFFSEAYEQHRYTPQEVILVVISFVCIISNFITLVEVYLYWIYWLDNAYYKLYVRDFLQKFMIILSCIVCFSFVFKTSRKQSLNSQESTH
jgi:hypothetical protein